MPSAPAYTACSILADMGDARAIPRLLEALDAKDPFLPQHAAQALGKLTNQRFGNDAAKWKQWWQEQSPKR